MEDVAIMADPTFSRNNSKNRERVIRSTSAYFHWGSAETAHAAQNRCARPPCF